MAKSGLSGRLFLQFVDELNLKLLIFNELQIIDASFVPSLQSSTIPETRTRTSRKAKGMACRTTNLTRRDRKMWRPDGHRKAGRTTSDTKKHIKMD